MAEDGTWGEDRGPNGPAPFDTGAGSASVEEWAFSEAELTALALAADPSAPLDDDAVPVAQYLGEHAGLLPAWYMPSPMTRTGSPWRIPVVVALVAAFVIIEAFGLCSTFGQLVPA